MTFSESGYPSPEVTHLSLLVKRQGIEIEKLKAALNRHSEWHIRNPVCKCGQVKTLEGRV